MVQSPKIKRRTSSRKPVTIDLDANEVSKAAEETDHTNATPENLQAEPVAFDELNEKSASSDGAKTDSDASGEAEAADATPNNTDEVPSENAAPPPPTMVMNNKSAGFVPGLIGGLVAILGLAGLQWGGILPSFAPAPEQVVAEPVDISPLQAEIDALKMQIADLGDNSAQTDIDPAVNEQIAAAVQSSDEALNNVSAAEKSISDLSAQFSQLQSAISSGASGDSAAMEAVSQRLDGVDQQIAELTTQLTASTENQTVNPEVTAQFDQLNEKLGALETTVSETQAATAQLSEDIAQGSGTNTNVASAIAVAGLKTAIDRGSSFMAELEAYATVAPNPEIIDDLRQFAASGVATVNQLSDGFPAIANNIVATGQGLPEDASVTDRLMASARSLVQVRPVGEVEGDTPGAIAARIEARLKQGDLTAALSEWETLPDAAKAGSSDFADQMRARQAVDAMVGDALNNAMAATAPSAN